MALDNDGSTMTATERFTQEIRDAAELLGITPGTLCNYAVGNGGLYKRLQAGRGVELETAERIRAYIRDNQPPPAANAPEHEGTDAT